MSMTTELELAQRIDLLIANGQQTADLLRHLADNEIDSDYFAVTSECEAYGTEIEAELSITDFALRAAGYVDALVEALEARDKQIAELGEKYNAIGVAIDAAITRGVVPESHPLRSRLEMLANYHKRITELERYRTAYLEWSDKTDWVQGDKRFDVVKPLGKHRADVLKLYIEHLEAKLATPVQLPKTNGYWTEQEKAYEEAITLAKRQIRLAGFRCEGDE